MEPGIKAEAREKIWSELTIEERIERLHQVFKENRSILNFVVETLGDLANHEHIDGKMVREILKPQLKGLRPFPPEWI